MDELEKQPETVSTEQASQKPVKKSKIEEVLDKEQLFRTIDKVRKQARPLEPLWGAFLFKKSITSIVGDPGAGKTTLGYDLANSLCFNWRVGG